MHVTRPFFVNLIFSPQCKQRALIDTGAFCSAMSKSMFESILESSCSTICQKLDPPSYKVSVASRSKVEVLFQADIKFNLGNKKFTERFLILPDMNDILLGLPFLDKNNVVVDCKRRLLKFTDFTFFIHSLQNDTSDLKIQNRAKSKFPLVLQGNVILAPSAFHLVVVSCLNGHELRDVTGLIEPCKSFESKYDVSITSAIETSDDKGNLYLGLLNRSKVPVELSPNETVAEFEVVTPDQAKFIVPIDPKILSLTDDSTCDSLLSQTILASAQNEQTPTSNKSQFWFPTPESCQNPDALTGIEKQIYDSLMKFQQMERLNPNNSSEQEEKFLSQFSWSKSIVSNSERTQIEKLLKKYHRIFARHRLDVGRNDDFKVLLTPEHDKPVYSQSPSTPIHIRDELLIELALLQYYGIITTLPFSKYASPIFAQRKPSGKLRLLIDLRKINHLLRHDYDSKNFPISTLADAGAHLAGKSFFCKLDCSQAYFALQMADQRSIELLAFNFASRTYAFLRLAQGLSRAVSTFSSFMRQKLDPCIITDKCFQYVDDVGTASNSVPEMIVNLECIFECIEKAGLKLSPGKCEFGTGSIEFLGQTITSEGVQPTGEKITKILENLQIPKTEKQIRRFIGFLQFYKAFIPKLSEKLLPFYKLLHKDQDLILESIHREIFDELKNELKRICQMTMRLPKTGCQYVILADASYYAAGFVLMIEDYVKNKAGKDVKIYSPVTFGSKIFQPAQLKLSIYAKEFLAVHFAFDVFAHIIWGAEKPVLVLTDNKSLIRFFQAKKIPAHLWNAVDHVLSFPFVLGHIPGRANLAADYLSRIHINPTEKLNLKIKEAIPLKSVELGMDPQLPDNSLCSVDIEQAELPSISSLYPSDNSPLIQIETENEVTPIAISREQIHPQIGSLNESNPLDNFDLTTHLEQINQIEEQLKDEDIQLAIKWIKGEHRIDRERLTPCQRKYAKQVPRLVIEKGVLFRKFFNDIGKVIILQFCVPAHLKDELLFRLHNDKQKSHPGIGKMLNDVRLKYYFPSFIESIVNYVRNCLTCLQAKAVKPASLRPLPFPIASQQSFPEDLLEIDLVGKMPGSQFKFVLTGIDVFTRYLFGLPLRSADAESVAKGLTSIFFRHSYLPKTILTDLGTVFTGNLIKNLSKTLGVKLKHATLKHAQTIGLLERSHASFKRALKVNENQLSSDWYNYVDVAVFAHNTTYHKAIGCPPSLLFHGREPYTSVDLRFNTSRQTLPNNHYDYISKLHSRMSELFVAARQNMVTSYHQNRKYYDRKCAASPLELHSYCLLLDPKVTNPNTSFEKQRSKLLPLYRVEKVLTHSNYIVRKVATNYTSLVHRIRLRPIKPQYAVNDLEEIDESKFEADPNTEEHEKEPQLLDSYIETSLELNTESEHRQVQFEDNSVNKNHPEREIGDTWLSKLNENSSSSEEFTVEGQNSTNDQMLTSECIDTENYNFRQKSAEVETTQPKYNLRTGDRMIALFLYQFVIIDYLNYPVTQIHYRQNRDNRLRKPLMPNICIFLKPPSEIRLLLNETTPL